MTFVGFIWFSETRFDVDFNQFKGDVPTCHYNNVFINFGIIHWLFANKRTIKKSKWYTVINDKKHMISDRYNLKLIRNPIVLSNFNRIK